MAGKSTKIAAIVIIAAGGAFLADRQFGTFNGNISALVGAGIGLQTRGVTDPSDNKTVRDRGVASTAGADPDSVTATPEPSTGN